jgi:hypothetical protein
MCGPWRQRSSLSSLPWRSSLGSKPRVLVCSAVEPEGNRGAHLAIGIQRALGSLLILPVNLPLLVWLLVNPKTWRNAP